MYEFNSLSGSDANIFKDITQLMCTVWNNGIYIGCYRKREMESANLVGCVVYCAICIPF